MAIHRMSRMQQVDFLLLKQAESIPLLTNKPVPKDQKEAMDYWFQRGRREAFMEARVLLRTEGQRG